MPRYINAKELKELSQFHKERGSEHEAKMYELEYEDLQREMDRD